MASVLKVLPSIVVVAVEVNALLTNIVPATQIERQLVLDHVLPILVSNWLPHIMNAFLTNVKILLLGTIPTPVLILTVKINTPNILNAAQLFALLSPFWF